MSSSPVFFIHEMETVICLLCSLQNTFKFCLSWELAHFLTQRQLRPLQFNYNSPHKSQREMVYLLALCDFIKKQFRDQLRPRPAGWFFFPCKKVLMFNSWMTRRTEATGKRKGGTQEKTFLLQLTLSHFVWFFAKTKVKFCQLK